MRKSRRRVLLVGFQNDERGVVVGQGEVPGEGEDRLNAAVIGPSQERAHVDLRPCPGRKVARDWSLRQRNGEVVIFPFYGEYEPQRR